MSSVLSISHLLRTVLFLALQISLFQQFHIFNTSKPFIYIFALLFLPMNAPKAYTLVYAFVLGLVIDIFSLSYGMNACACLVVAMLKDPFLKWIVGIEDEDLANEPHAYAINFTNFLLYVISMTFVHSLIVMLLENFTWQNLFQTLFSALVSTLVTTVLIVMIEILFFRNNRRGT